MLEQGGRRRAWTPDERAVPALAAAVRAGQGAGVGSAAGRLDGRRLGDQRRDLLREYLDWLHNVGATACRGLATDIQVLPSSQPHQPDTPQISSGLARLLGRPPLVSLWRRGWRCMGRLSVGAGRGGGDRREAVRAQLASSDGRARRPGSRGAERAEGLVLPTAIADAAAFSRRHSGIARVDRLSHTAALVALAARESGRGWTPADTAPRLAGPPTIIASRYSRSPGGGARGRR